MKVVDHIVGVPANLFRLRWILVSKNGVEIKSTWTPDCQYPSMREILEEFEGNVDAVYVEGRDLVTGVEDIILKCPGSQFKSFSYKSMITPASGNSVLIGIEIDTIKGDKFLALRDGTIYKEGNG